MKQNQPYPSPPLHLDPWAAQLQQPGLRDGREKLPGVLPDA